MRMPHPMKVAGVALMVFAVAPSAFATNWVDTGHAILIDVDSIRKGPDGLIYHLEKQTYSSDDLALPPLEAATDCVKRISYSGYSLKYQADWRSRGEPVMPGTMGAALLDFVCDRVK
ncbi:MAG: hypothetical protein ABL956_15670 [Hyphomonadaceae bacterium]